MADEDTIRRLMEGTGFNADGLADALQRARLDAAHILPEHRFRWIAACNTAEILEACDEEERFTGQEREMIHAAVHTLMQMVNALCDVAQDRSEHDA